MKKLFLILIILGVFLGANMVCAVEYTSLKNPTDFKAFDSTGLSTKESDGRVELSVVPLNENSTKYITGNADNVDGNIYKFSDFGYSELHSKFGYEGYVEVVEIDGEQYVASVLFESNMSPGEEKEFLSVITEFNKLNNLTPLSIDE